MYKDKTVLLVAAIYRGLVNVKRTGIHIAMSDNRINFQIDPNPHSLNENGFSNE